MRLAAFLGRHSSCSTVRSPTETEKLPSSLTRTASLVAPETSLLLDRADLALGRCCVTAPCLSKHNDNNANDSLKEEATSIRAVSSSLRRAALGLRLSATRHGRQKAARGYDGQDGVSNLIGAWLYATGLPTPPRVVLAVGAAPMPGRRASQDECRAVFCLKVPR
jgi:hypothetical protein